MTDALAGPPPKSPCQLIMEAADRWRSTTAKYAEADADYQEARHEETRRCNARNQAVKAEAEAWKALEELRAKTAPKI